jgi:glycosyltransferase involved in cell wall biosynthesis
MQEKPQLSIIIASFNSENFIKSCLESLKNQNTDQPLEIIVVDSSMDGVSNLVKETYPDARLHQLSERKFCGDARNIGLSVANGEIIAFIDADCRADQNWANQILKAHQSSHLAIGGAIGNGNPENTVGWASYFCEFSQWMPGSPLGKLADIAGANMSYKRRAFEEHGLFIEGTYSSDTEFHWRLRRKNNFLQFVPSILVFHHNIDRLGKFLAHEFEHGRSFARVRVKSRNFSEWRRLFYATFAFLIPGWLFLKIGLRNLRNRIYLFHFLKASHLLILGLISWSLGEHAGYIKGFSSLRETASPSTAKPNVMSPRP